MKKRSPKPASAETRETWHSACKTWRYCCCKTGTRRGRADPSSRRLRIVRDIGLRALGVGVIEVAGGIALASGDLVSGIRLGGASGALFQAMGIVRDPVSERMHAQIVASVRPKLGEQAFAQLAAEGAALSYEAALEEARDWLEADATPG